MNTPVRRVAIAVMGMILLLMANLTYVQVVKAGDYRNDSRNQRVLLAEYSPPARPDQRRRARCWPAASRPTTGCATSAQYPDGPVYAPVTGYYSVLYSSQRHGAGRGRGAQRQRRPAVRPPAVRPDHRPRPQRRQRRADHRPGRSSRPPTTQLTARGLRRLGGGAAPADRRDPGDGLHAVLRPEPAGQPQLRGADGGLGAVQRRRAAGADQPGDLGDLPARLDVQADRHRGRAGSGGYTPDSQLTAASDDHAAGHQHRPGELQRQRLRHGRDGHACATRCRARATPRSPQLAARARRRQASATRPRRSASAPRRPADPDAGGALDARRHPGHRVAAAVRDRAARRRGSPRCRTR